MPLCLKNTRWIHRDDQSRDLITSRINQRHEFPRDRGVIPKAAQKQAARGDPAPGGRTYSG
jgi:hypothetical protein